MALKIIGESGYEADVNTDKALYVESRCPAYGNFGSFSAALLFGGRSASGTNGQNIACLRWTSSAGVCLIKKIMVYGYEDVGSAPMSQFSIAAYFARSFTAPPTPTDTSGINIFFMGHNNNKLCSSSSSSFATTVATSSTDDGMGGTYTADTNPLAIITGFANATTGTSMFSLNDGYLPLIDRTGYGQYPIVLAKNEGMIISSTTGNVINSHIYIFATINWTEASTY